MARTWIDSVQIEDGEVKRNDLNINESGQAVCRKIIPGTNVTLDSTGADEGTGDVTINVVVGQEPLKYSGEALLDFGPVSQIDWATETTVDAEWITYEDKIDFYIGYTSDHDPADAAIDGIIFYVGNIQPYKSFDFYASCPDGTWGLYKLCWEQK